MARYVQMWKQVGAPGGDGLITVWRCYDLTTVNAGTPEQDNVVGPHMNTTNATRPAGFNRNGSFFVDNATGSRVAGVTLRFTDTATGQQWDVPVVIPKGRSVYTAAEFASFTADSPSGSYTHPDQYGMHPIFTEA